MSMDSTLIWFIVYYILITVFFLMSPYFLPKTILYCSECEDISYWYRQKWEGQKRWKREPRSCFRCGATAKWVDLPNHLDSKRLSRWMKAVALLYPVGLLLLLLYLPQFHILMWILLISLVIAVIVLLVYQESKSQVEVKLWLREHYKKKA